MRHELPPRFAFAASLAAVAWCSLTFHASAQTTSDLTLNPWGQGIAADTVDKLLYQQQGDVAEEPQSNAQVFWWDSTGRVRFNCDDPQSFSLGYRYLTMSFDTNSPRLPDTLDDISLAAGLHLGEIGNGQVMAVLGAGYSGDNLFADINGLYGIGHLTWETKLNEHDSLVLSLDYDGNSAFLPDVPLPGFRYTHRDEKLAFAIGYPISSLRWDLMPKLTLTANYMVPYSGSVALEYRLNDQFSLFGEYDNFFHGFVLDGEERTDRIFYQMSRAEVGLRYQNPDVFKGVSLDAEIVVGYAFDQNFSRGFDVRSLDTFTSISDEPYIGIVLRGTF